MTWRFSGELADLVEEEGPSGGLLEEAAPIARGVGEGPLLVPEELALEQVLGDRAAVQRDEGERLPVGVRVERARDQFLAHAALAADEDGGLELGDLRDRPEDVAHGGALGEDRLELMLAANLLLQGPVLAAQRLALLGLAEGQDDLVRLERLAHVVVRAGLHGLEGEIDVPVRAHHDDRRRVLLGLEGREQIEPAHPRHAHVGQDDVRPEDIHQRQRGLPAVRDLHLVAVLLEEGAEDQSNVLFVVDDQDTAHDRLTSRRSANVARTTLPRPGRRSLCGLLSHHSLRCSSTART